MPTDPGGALGSLDYTKEERRALTIKSRESAPRFGTPGRQMLIDEIHQYMLSKVPSIPQLVPPLHTHEEHSTNGESGAAQINNQDAGVIAEDDENADPRINDMIVQDDVREVHWNANAGPLRVSFSARMRVTQHVNPDEQLQRRPEARTARLFDDRLFTWTAIGLTIIIAVLLFKKFLKASGYGASGMNEL